MTPDDVRALALALPGTLELPHHERTSFRNDGRIFATMPPDGESVTVLLYEEGARAAASDKGVEVRHYVHGFVLAGLCAEQCGG